MRGGSAFTNAASIGFGGTLGVFGALALFLLIGLLFFIPGLLIYINQQKKQKKLLKEKKLRLLWKILVKKLRLSLPTP